MGRERRERIFVSGSLALNEARGAWICFWIGIGLAKEALAGAGTKTLVGRSRESEYRKGFPPRHVICDVHTRIHYRCCFAFLGFIGGDALNRSVAKQKSISTEEIFVVIRHRTSESILISTGANENIRKSCHLPESRPQCLERSSFLRLFRISASER